jgi:hypothetical protein
MEALIEYGHALGRAHTGDLDGARKAIARMQELRDATKDPKFDYFKSHLDLQMQAASAWVAASEGKKNEAIEMLRRAAMPKTFWASIRFRRERLFPFANNSAVCCWKSANRRKHSGNSKLPSKYTRDDSEVCMELRELPSKLATKKMQAAITRNSPRKRQSLAAHEMN